MMPTRFVIQVFGALLFGLVGCKQAAPVDAGEARPLAITLAEMTYGELLDQYNQNLEKLGTLWCRTDVVIRWVEEDDQGQQNKRREKGEGKIMYRRPGDTALLVEKLGQIYLWAGSDEERYWLFDVSDSEAKKGYVGTFDRIAQPGTRRYPLPVRPDAVPVLLGLTALPPIDGAQMEPVVEMYQGQYLVELLEARIRMLIDPETFRPTRVDLLDERGFSVLTARLKGRFPVRVPGLRKSRWPIICERLEIDVVGYESQLTVAMDDASADPRKLSDEQFDFKTLCQGLRVQEIIPLDRE